MSFVHHVCVGYFGEPEEARAAREIGWEECVGWLLKYNDAADPALRITIEPEPDVLAVRRTRVLAYVEGFPVGLKQGVLLCPVLTTHYLLASIAFVAFVHQTAGCAIFSHDEGRFLTLEEFVPKHSFGEELRYASRDIVNPPDVFPPS